MLPPGLSMLWETVDPARALTERFGFTGTVAAATWVTEALHRHWAVEAGDCRRIVISGPNALVWIGSDRGPLVLKWSAAEPRFAALATSTRLQQWLAGHDLPVAAALPATDGEPRLVLEGPRGPMSVAVLPELSGDWLDLDDEAAVHDAGAVLARLHRALERYPDTDTATREVTSVSRRVEHWLTDHDHPAAPRAEAALTDRIVGLPPLETPIQLVHNDYRGANLLVRDSVIIGVLDFDEMTLDHRVADLARASVMLGTRFTDWRPTPLVAQRTFRAGYESVCRLEPVEAAWLEPLVLGYAIGAIPAVPDPAGWAAAVDQLVE